jgi:hypothetical protein
MMRIASAIFGFAVVLAAPLAGAQSIDRGDLANQAFYESSTPPDVQRWIDGGADVNFRGSFGYTPLIVAAFH